MTLYTFRTGDDVCTPFKTDDPAIAAGLYADENGPGQVFVVVCDRIDEYDVDGEHGAWLVEHIGSRPAPTGWFQSGPQCSWCLGWDGLAVAARPEAQHRDIEVRSEFGVLDYFGPDTLDVAIGRAWTAETEAVLRMAAHVAWGGREGGEVRP